MRLKLGFLASHNGTDMRAIIETIEAGVLDAEAKVVISNNSHAPALEYAKKHNIPSFHVSRKTHKDKDGEIKNILTQHGVNLVLLSGYMKKIGPKTLSAFENRILNVHPALLPKYSGLYGDAVHAAVLQNHELETGATIHVVDALYDHGKIISQAKVRVKKGDSVGTLKNKVQEEEKRLYIKLLQDISQGKISLI